MSGALNGYNTIRPAAFLLILLVCGVAYAFTMAPGITWANSGQDSAELVAAALVGGVAHPPGHPTYMLLARLFLALPLGEPARAVTLLSALAATLTALLLYDLVRRWSDAGEPWASVGGLTAALALALAPLFWSQAVIAEVYCLAALFAVLLLREAFLEQKATDRGAWFGLVAGVGLGAHLTILPFVLLWAAAVARGSGGGVRLVRRMGWLCLGLLVYLYLPLSAQANPPINWGNPAGWDGFWWLVSGQLYAKMVFGLPPEQLGTRLAAWAGLLGEQFGPAGLLLGGCGLLGGGRRAVGLRLAGAGLAFLLIAFALGYNSVDAHVYLIPALLLIALWIGLGLAALLASISARHPALALPAALVLAAAILWPAPLNAARVDASGDRRAIDYAESLLAQAPAGALILAGDDRATFPLWYYHFGLGRRPDLRVVATPLLGFDWYRAGLRAAYPDLKLPATAPAGWEAALIEGHGGVVCWSIGDGELQVDCVALQPGTRGFGIQKVWELRALRVLRGWYSKGMGAKADLKAPVGGEGEAKAVDLAGAALRGGHGRNQVGVARQQDLHRGGLRGAGLALEA